MSSQLESIYSDELILLAETLGEVKTRTEKLEGEFSTHAKPLEAATNALSAALSGIKALQFHILDNNLGALSARVEEMRKAVDEQVGVIALELKKADETNAAKAGAEAEALRSEIVALQSQLGSLVTQFGQQLERVEFAAKEEAKKLQLIPGPAGAAGASLNPRGTFIDGETYNRLDVVSWLGSSYIASVDGVTEKPSKNSNQWQTLASRGGGGAGGVGDFGSLAGVAQINQGGTGQTTRVAALNALLPDQAGSTQYMLLTDGSGTVSWGAQPVAGLPSQTSNSGRLLTTNGSTASWSNAVTVSGSNATVGGTLTVSGGTITGGSSGMSLASGGTNQQITLTPNGTGFVVTNTSNDGVTPTLVRFLNPGATTAGRYNEVQFGAVINDGGAGTIGYKSDTATPANSRLFIVHYGKNQDSAGLNLTNTGNLLIGGTTDISGNGGLKVFGTTASTSTSSGALVVGNGTSGGLGVGGAINAGGALTAAGYSRFTGDTTGGGSDVWVGASGDGGIFVNTPAGESIYLGINNTPTATIAPSLATFTGVLKTTSTTASTSTSSGALVVSGGVGVAGAIYAGAAITSNYSSAANTGFSVINTNSAGSPGLYLEGDAGEYAIIRRGGSTYNNPRTLEYVATGSGAKHLFNTTAQFDGTVIAAASSNAFRITTAQTPASATATGTAGTIAWDTSYIYVCTATNTWKRVAISTW